MSERQDYYGTKRVTAWRKDTVYTKEGYAVKYADGYESWSPKKAFEAAYKPITAMDFSGALAAMLDGYRVRRSGWAVHVAIRLASPTGNPLFLSVTDGKDMDEWLPNTRQILAADWMIAS